MLSQRIRFTAAGRWELRGIEQLPTREEQPSRYRFPAVPRQMDVGQPEERGSLEEAQQLGIDVGIEAAVTFLERSAYGADATCRTRILQRQQREVSEEVGDVDGRLGHRGVIEVEHRESVVPGQDLIMMKVAVSRSPSPGRPSPAGESLGIEAFPTWGFRRANPNDVAERAAAGALVAENRGLRDDGGLRENGPSQLDAHEDRIDENLELRQRGVEGSGGGGPPGAVRRSIPLELGEPARAQPH